MSLSPSTALLCSRLGIRVKTTQPRRLTSRGAGGLADSAHGRRTSRPVPTSSRGVSGYYKFLVHWPIHLTLSSSYDDGPSPWTPDLLNFMSDKNLTSTFFIVGSRVRISCVLHALPLTHPVGHRPACHPSIRVHGRTPTLSSHLVPPVSHYTVERANHSRAGLDSRSHPTDHGRLSKYYAPALR